MKLFPCVAVALSVIPLLHANAQAPSPLTRAQAIAAALEHGPRLPIAQADTMIAAAQLITAHALPNPSLSASYSKSAPQYHLTAEMPLDFVGLRGIRIDAASAARIAAQYRFAFDRASIALDADTSYTRALAAVAHIELSQRNAMAADSVLRIAVARRDAGDASELDVQLATVTAGQAGNALASDSLTLAAALLDLQSLIGLPSDQPTVTLSDTLEAPMMVMGSMPAGPPLNVASATATVESATLQAKLQHRSTWLLPGIMFGFETGDPSGAEPGILPTFGITVPLPLLNRNRGPIAEAEAVRARASAELELARVESQNGIAQARRAEAAAESRIGRDRLLLASANRVAEMSLTAYREGAATLASVLEAQRTARDILGQYIDDVAAGAIAAAQLRTLTLTSSSVPTP